jgi:hypothetical protein
MDGDAVDPLSFPVLAGSALTQAFGFLYGRLAAVLDRRAKRAELEAADADAHVVSETGEKSDGLVVDDVELERRQEQMIMLSEALAVYRDHPERLDGRDEQLRLHLASLHEALEAVYGVPLDLFGEPTSRPGLRVEQRVTDLASDMIGLDAEEVGGAAQAHVIQTSETVRPGAKVVGAKVKRLG